MRRGNGPVMFNIRVRPTSANVAVTREALDRVTEYVKENDAVPRGWELAYIEWTNPAKASRGWKRGGEEDLAYLGRVLRKMPSSKLKLRAAEVEQPRGRKGSSRELRDVLERADKWHRARSKEMRAVERLKTKEARQKHRHQAEKYRKLYAKAQARAESLSREEGAPEFELAVDYKRRKK